MLSFPYFCIAFPYPYCLTLFWAGEFAIVHLGAVRKAAAVCRTKILLNSGLESERILNVEGVFS